MVGEITDSYYDEKCYSSTFYIVPPDAQGQKFVNVQSDCFSNIRLMAYGFGIVTKIILVLPSV